MDHRVTCTHLRSPPPTAEEWLDHRQCKLVLPLVLYSAPSSSQCTVQCSSQCTVQCSSLLARLCCSGVARLAHLRSTHRSQDQLFTFSPDAALLEILVHINSADWWNFGAAANCFYPAISHIPPERKIILPKNP